MYILRPHIITFSPLTTYIISYYFCQSSTLFWTQQLNGDSTLKLLKCIMINLFRRWKPKGKMYSLRCSQCGSGFLSSYDLEAPICGKCLQKAKSLDSTIDHDKICIKCGKRGVIYGKEQCHSCYFGFEKSESLSSKWSDHPARVVIQGLMDHLEKLDYEYTISDWVFQSILKRQARQIISNNNISIGSEHCR
jgi:ribosomal protein L37E